MKTSARRIELAIVGLVALVGLIGAVGPAAANTIDTCTQAPTNTVTVPPLGSVVVKYTITYDDFASDNSPVTLSAAAISGYTINSSTFIPNTGSGTHTATVYLKVTNTAAPNSGTYTLTLSWPNDNYGVGFGLCGSLKVTTPAGTTSSTSTVSLPPPVPQFPAGTVGFAALMAVAITALVLMKKKTGSGMPSPTPA